MVLHISAKIHSQRGFFVRKTPCKNKARNNNILNQKVNQEITNVAYPIMAHFSEDNRTAAHSACEINDIEKVSAEKSWLQEIIKPQFYLEVKDALEFAYLVFYSKPYTNLRFRKREAQRSVAGEKIYRYNHGLATAVRKAFFVPFIVDYFERHGLDSLHSQLKCLFAAESKENVIKKIQLVMAFEVAGRDSECGSRDNLEVYTRYLHQSKEAFLEYCRGANLVGRGKLFINEDQLKYYAKAITEKYPNRSRGDNMDVVTAIADTAHMLDEFRCYWPSRMANEIDSLNAYSKNKNTRDLACLAKFCQECIEATGDRVMSHCAKSTSRKIKFAESNVKSLIINNHRFVYEEKFVACSANPTYCWNVLSKVSRPISFSRGETTYLYLKAHRENVPISEVISTENSNDINEIEKLKEIITSAHAAIRLVNTSNSSFDYEIGMLTDPVFSRPCRASPSDRDVVLADRENGSLKHRGYKDRIPLAHQQEANPTPALNIWPPVHREEDRGKAKYSQFTKKLSLSLLRPDGRVKHFTGRVPQEYFTFQPIGMLYDVRLLDQRNEKFVFNYDVATSSKFWIGENSPLTIDKKVGRNTNFSLSKLQTMLVDEALDNKEITSLPFIKGQHASNEILMGLSAKALKAVFATEDSAEARIRTFLHAVYLSQDCGLTLPVLVIDGQSIPRTYSQIGLLQDLEDICGLKNRKLFKKLLRCFYSKEEIETKRPTIEDIGEKCTAFFPLSILPMTQESLGLSQKKLEEFSE